MALLWNSLATRETKLLRIAMERRFDIPHECDWVNYVRCHDDIGWAFSNDDVDDAGFDPKAHRRFLTNFFTGKFQGSYSKGLPFQEDRHTGDARVSGTCASLCGIERGLEDEDEREIELAIRRILLIHGVIMTIGGIPLIYLGDEIATLNDNDFDQDPAKRGDTRWLHRAEFDWSRAQQRNNLSTIPGRVHQGLLRLIQLRQQNLAFSRAETEIVDTGNAAVFGYFRNNQDYSVLVLGNFSELPQKLEGRHLRLLGLRKTVVDMVSGNFITALEEMTLEPYQFAVLSRPR